MAIKRAPGRPSMVARATHASHPWLPRSARAPSPCFARPVSDSEIPRRNESAPGKAHHKQQLRGKPLSCHVGWRMTPSASVRFGELNIRNPTKSRTRAQVQIIALSSCPVICNTHGC